MPKFSRFTLIKLRPLVLSLSFVLAGALLAASVLRGAEASSFVMGDDVASAAKASPVAGAGAIDNVGRRFLDHSGGSLAFNAGGMSSALFMSPIVQNPSAYSLSLGGGSRVDVPSSASLNITGPVTVEAWVKTTSTADQAVVERYATWPGAGVANGGYVLRLMGRRVTFATLRNSNEFDYQQGATTVSVGVWHHVAGVYDGSQLRVYLDGVLDGSKASTFAPATGTAPVRIGAKGDDATLPFNGLIDEARVSAAALYAVNFTPATSLTSINGVKGLWKFDEQGAGDSSGYGNHGTLTGAASFSAETCDNYQTTPDNSLSLGGGSRVDVPSSASLNITGPVTVEAWVKTTSTADQAVVERYATWPGAGVANGGYVLRLMGRRVTFATLRNSNEFDYQQGATTVSVGVWHHVAGVYDGSQLRVYLDGVLDGSKATTMAPATGTAPVRIGAKGDDLTLPFNGLIDEARVSAAALYALNFTPATRLSAVANTRGLWKLDDQTAADSSGNNNHGTLQGGTSFSADTPHHPPGNGPGAYSLLLNGADGYVLVPNSPALNLTGRLTVEAWIKTNSSAQQGIVERYGSAGTEGGFALRLVQGRLRFYTLRNSTDYDFVEGSTLVTAGVWHHVAGVFDGSELRVYLDGKADGLKSSTVAPATGTQSLKIGARGDDGAFRFNGLIDEVRVSAGVEYSGDFTARSIREVGSAFENPNDGQRGVWLFDDGTANDASGANNHGTLIGGALLSTESFSAVNINYVNILQGTSADTQVAIGFDGLDGQKVSNQYQEAKFCAINSGLNIACSQQSVGPYYTYATTLAPAYESSGPRLTRGTQSDIDTHLTSTSGRFRNFRVEFPKLASNIKFQGIGVLLNSGVSEGEPEEGCGWVAQINIYRSDSPTPTQPKTYGLCGRPVGAPTDKPVLYDLNKMGAKNVTAIEIHTIVDISGIDFDTFEFTVPPAPEVTSVLFEELSNGGPIDRHPTDPVFGCQDKCGQRIFADKNNPSDTANRAKVRVKAVTTFPQGTKIYFKSFDLDDPSSNHPDVDPTGSQGFDNRGGPPLSGTLAAAFGTTDASGVATVEFEVKKQPGNNYMVAASADETYLNGLTEEGIGLRDAGGNVLPTSKARTTEMLTVWRRLHIEVDSMGPATGNGLVATVENLVAITGQNQPQPSYIRPDNFICVQQALEPDRFKGGRVVAGESHYQIISNDTSCLTVVAGPEFTPPPQGSQVTIYDDDDFNNDDGSLLNGDEGDDIPAPHTSKVQGGSAGDSPANNLFAPAYVRPVYDVGDANNSVPFAANLAADSQAAKRALYDFDQKATEADADFWTVYLLGAYQFTPEADFDPDFDGGLTLGIVDNSPQSDANGDLLRDGWGALFFFEMEREARTEKALGFNVSEFALSPWWVPHEIGHLFGARHSDLGLMSQASGSFSPLSLDRIRRTTHP